MRQFLNRGQCFLQGDVGLVQQPPLMVRHMAHPHKALDLGEESTTLVAAVPEVLAKARHQGRIQACSVRIFRHIRLVDEIEWYDNGVDRRRRG